MSVSLGYVPAVVKSLVFVCVSGIIDEFLDLVVGMRIVCGNSIDARFPSPWRW